MNRQQLRCLQVKKNVYYYSFISLLLFSQIVIVFFLLPKCGNDVSNEDTSGKTVFPRLAVNIVDIICVVVYSFEVIKMNIYKYICITHTHCHAL